MVEDLVDRAEGDVVVPDDDADRHFDGLGKFSATRVLFLTHVGDPGGAEYKMIDLCRVLGESAEVLLFQRGSLEAILSEHRIRFCVHQMPAATRDVRREDGMASLAKAIPGVLSMIRSVARKAKACDVLVCFSQKSFVLAALAKPFMRRPILWFMNDILSPEHFSRTFIRLLVTLSRYSADRIVLNSQASLDAWIEAGGRTRNVSVVYPGVQEDQIDSQLKDPRLIASYKEQYSPGGKPLIGMFGRIGRWKGQEVFLKAIAQLPHVQAVIVGGALFGEEDYERCLHELADELGLKPRVAFVGHVDNPMTLMAACDVVAHCSTAPEPFGLVIAEAMLAGTPVIASDAGGAREIVTQGETGQLTSPKDPAALAAAIRRYLDDPRWAQQLARRARSQAQEKFSGTAMTVGFLRVLDTLPRATETSFSDRRAPQPMLAQVRRLNADLLFGKRPLFAMFRSVGTQLAIAVINLLTGVVTARLLGPEGRGVFAAVTTWPQLLATLSVSGLRSAVVFRMRKFPQLAHSVAGAALLLTFAGSLAMIAMGFLLLPVLMVKYPPAVVWLAQGCLVSVLISSMHMTVKQIFAGSGEFGQYNLAILLPQLLYLVALLSMIPFAAMTASGAILALLGTAAVAALVTLPKFIRLVRPSFKGAIAEARQLTSYSARAAPMDVVLVLATYADRLVLIPLLPVSDLGFYAVAFSFSRVIQLVQPAIASVVLSHMSGQTESGGKLLHDYACRFLLAGLLAGCTLFWIASEPLLVFAYGAQFAAAADIVRLLVLEASLGALSQVTVQLFLSRDRPGVVSALELIVLGISIFAMLALVPHYGALGAAAALVGAGLLRWLLLLGAVKTVLRLPLPRLYLCRGDFEYLRGRLR